VRCPRSRWRSAELNGKRNRSRDTGRAMSHENVEMVRHSLELAADSRRRLEERLALRVPYRGQAR